MKDREIIIRDKSLCTKSTLYQWKLRNLISSTDKVEITQNTKHQKLLNKVNKS